MTFYPSDTLPRPNNVDESVSTQEKEMALSDILGEAQAAFEHRQDRDARRADRPLKAGEKQFAGN